MAPKTLKNPKGKKVTREVEIGLDTETRAKLAEELGEKLKAKTKLDAEFSEVKQKWKDRIQPVADRIGAIENFLENGKEKKTVETIMVKNHDENKVEYWFQGKIVDWRHMNESDRQEDMTLKTKRGASPDKRLGKDAPIETRDEEIKNIHKLETSRKTKHSATDGPVGKGHANGVDSTTTGA